MSTLHFKWHVSLKYFWNISASSNIFCLSFIFPNFQTFCILEMKTEKNLKCIYLNGKEHYETVFYVFWMYFIVKAFSDLVVVQRWNPFHAISWPHNSMLLIVFTILKYNSIGKGEPGAVTLTPSPASEHPLGSAGSSHEWRWHPCPLSLASQRSEMQFCFLQLPERYFCWDTCMIFQLRKFSLAKNIILSYRKLDHSSGACQRICLHCKGYSLEGSREKIHWTETTTTLCILNNNVPEVWKSTNLKSWNCRLIFLYYMHDASNHLWDFIFKNLILSDSLVGFFVGGFVSGKKKTHT